MAALVVGALCGFSLVAGPPPIEKQSPQNRQTDFTFTWNEPVYWQREWGFFEGAKQSLPHDTFSSSLHAL